MTPTTRAQELAAELALLNAQDPDQPGNPEDNNSDHPHTPPAPSVHDENENDVPVNNEEHRFAKVLASALSEAITQALIVARATAAPDPAKYPKAKDPGMFNGRKRRYLRTWIGENEICFRTAPNLYRAETSKVMFAGSFLEGDAKTWFTDYFHDPANIPPFMSDWTLFVIELQNNFGLEDELGAAEEDMRKLTMTDKDHASYFTARFRAIVANLGGTWDDRNLRNQYYQKLAPRIRAQFVSAGSPVPAKLEALVAQVDRFDRAYWSDYEMTRALSSYASPAEKKPNPIPTTSKPTPRSPATPVNSGTNPRTNPKSSQLAHLTKEGKLTAEEKQRRMDAGACFYCGEVGHLTAACPKKGQPRARAVMESPTGTTAVIPTEIPTNLTKKQTARASLVVLNDSEESGND